MNSLSQLNTYSDTTLTFTDLRSAKVVFDRVTPTAQTASYTVGGTFTVPLGINILDIVLPGTEQVYFQVDVSNAAGATVTFPTLPSGYSVTTIGSGVYRVSNIQSQADWDLIKNALVQTASGYKATFSATAIIGYESTKTKTWTIAAQSTVRARLTSSATITASGGYLVGVAGTVITNSQFTLATNPNYLRGSNNVLRSAFTIRATASDVVLTARSTLSTNANKISGLIAGVDAFSYIANTANASKFNNIRITDDNPASYSYSVTLSSPNGRIGTSTSSSSSYTVSGTFAQVNDFFAGNSLIFYPDKNYQSNTTYTAILKKSGTTIKTVTRTVTYASTYSTTDRIMLTQSGTWTPTFAQVTYGTAAILTVGGGGGGGYNYTAPQGIDFTELHGGGGGGGVKLVESVSLANQSYSYTIGYRGASGYIENGQTYSYPGYPGGTTQFNGVTGAYAYGGLGGSGTAVMATTTTFVPNFTQTLGKGGTSGSPTAYAGGVGGYSSGSAANTTGGGGGAGGAGGNGDPAGNYGGTGGTSVIVPGEPDPSTYSFGGGGGGSGYSTSGGAVANGSGGATRTTNATTPLANRGHGGGAGFSGDAVTRRLPADGSAGVIMILITY